MKFLIDSTRYFAREEENGSLSLIHRTTNAVHFLNRGARRLLDACDEWTDLDAFVDGKQYTNVPREKIIRDYTMLLYELDAIGVAELKDVPSELRDGVFLALPKDYRELSAFLSAHFDAPKSCSIAMSGLQYHRSILFSRIKSGSSRYVYHCLNGEIVGALEFSAAQAVFSPMAITLQSVILSSALSDEEDAEEMKLLLDGAAKLFAKNYRKLRYARLNPRQDEVCEVLLQNGFVKSAALENELWNGLALVAYDRFIAAEDVPGEALA